MRLRALRRAVALAFSLAVIVLSWWLTRLRGRTAPADRAVWLHRACSRILKALGIRVSVHGPLPLGGLVVANHLSYLDIMILSTVMPCFFVSKVEIAGWPYFGKAARTGATIFIDRRSRAGIIEVAGEMSERLRLNIPVLLFPEGTSTDGSKVLPFHSSLFEPAIASSSPITAAAVRYILHDGSRERDLCWFDDSLFLPHLWKALGTAGFSAEITFGEPHYYTDRRTAADATREEVAAMRANQPASAIDTQFSAASAG